MVGDKASDIEAGRRAGCKTILALTGQGKKEYANAKADLVSQTIYHATDLLTKMC
jgi:phosphoglycolate phosphatase-like HAD superfamily hydrolase